MAMTAQIAQPSGPFWSLSGLAGTCFGLACSLWTARSPLATTLLCGRADWVVVTEGAASAWKCPNDSANCTNSANSANRAPLLMFERNHFMSDHALIGKHSRCYI